jgi:hypothetical protein
MDAREIITQIDILKGDVLTLDDNIQQLQRENADISELTGSLESIKTTQAELDLMDHLASFAVKYESIVNDMSLEQRKSYAKMVLNLFNQITRTGDYQKYIDTHKSAKYDLDNLKAMIPTKSELIKNYNSRKVMDLSGILFNIMASGLTRRPQSGNSYNHNQGNIRYIEN